MTNQEKNDKTEKAESATLSKGQGISSRDWQVIRTENASAKSKLTQFSYRQGQSV